MKHKNHITISIDAEKPFDKIQHSFMIKLLNKVGIEGTYLNLIKSVYDMPIANIILIGEKLKSISSTIRNKTRMLTLSTFIWLDIGSLATAIRQENEIKGIQIEKEEIKLTLFADDMTVYTEKS